MPAKSQKQNKIKRPYGLPQSIFGHGVMLRRLSAIAIFVFLMGGACMDIQLRIGTRPDTAVLEEKLHAGKSTDKDVIAALGLPDGKGKAMLPIDKVPKELWSYYYEEGSFKDARRIFLFVFFDQDRYDGYMWFSSLPE
jgi:hypothetical protein